MKSLLTALLLIVSFTLGGVTQYVTSQPHCPTEDSCEISYDHGKWTITEVQP